MRKSGNDQSNRDTVGVIDDKAGGEKNRDHTEREENIGDNGKPVVFACSLHHEATEKGAGYGGDDAGEKTDTGLRGVERIWRDISLGIKKDIWLSLTDGLKEERQVK